MTFDVKAAKGAGYSQQEIDSFLTKQQISPSFDIESAKSAGYSDEEVQNFIKKKNPSLWSTITKHKKEAALSIPIALAQTALSTVLPEPQEPAPQVARAIQDIRAGLVPREGWTPIPEGEVKQRDKLQYGEELQKMAGISELPGEEQQNLALMNFLIQMVPSLAGAAKAGFAGLRKTPIPAETTYMGAHPAKVPNLPSQLVKTAMAPVEEAEKSAFAQSFKQMEGPPPSEPEQMYALREQEIARLNQPPRALGAPTVQIGPQPTAGGQPLTGRVQSKQIEKPLGTSQISLPAAEPEAAKPIGKAEVILPKKEGEVPDFASDVSKERIQTKAEGGSTAANTMKENMRRDRENVVDPAYEKAEETTRTFDSAFPVLADYVDRLIIELEAIPMRNAGEEAVFKQANNIRDMIGGPTGLIEANAAELMNQSNSMTSMANYETTYTGAKGRIKALSSAINRDVINQLEEAGLDANSVIGADKKYAKWADKYFTDELDPFLKKKVLNPEELFNKMVKDPATYRAVRNAIGRENMPLKNKIDRAILEDKFKKYSDRPELTTTFEFKQDVADAKKLIGNEQVSKVEAKLKRNQAQVARKQMLEKRIKEREASMKEEGAPLKERVKAATREVPKKAEVNVELTTPAKEAKELKSGKISSDTLNRISNEFKANKALKPETIDTFFKSKSNIRLFREKMKRAGMESIFQKEADYAIENIFREGLHERPKIWGSEIAQIANKNYEIISELKGRQFAKDFLQYFTKRGKREFASRAMFSMFKKLGGLTVGGGAAGKIVAGTTEKILTQALEHAE